MNIITGETTENIETTSLRTQSDVKTKISKKVYIKIKRVIDVILASVALIICYNCNSNKNRFKGTSFFCT